MSCPGNFLAQTKLRRYDAVSNVVAQSADGSQAVALCRGRAGNDDHTIEVLLNIRFIQQGYVEEKPLFLRFRFPDEGEPSFANAGMKNRLQLLPGGILVENTLAQGTPVRRPIFV